MEVRDAKMKVTRALPDGAANVTSAAISTGVETHLGKQLALLDFLLTAPAMATGVMGDGKTMTYDIVMGDSSDLTDSPVTLYPGFLVQTGAGGDGAAAAAKRFRIPSDAKPFIGFKATGSASGDASGASATLEVLF